MVAITSKEFKESSVADFYAGKSVFITGGTGFLGKVFIEKLLYSCPDIKTIYMLVREKKGLSVQERMKEFVDDQLFDRLKDVRPEDLDKIIFVPGNITAPNLGISEENEKTLIEKVSVVIHSAATVKFNEPLQVAWKINVEGTRMTLDFCRRMKRVEVFIHVSTAYTNTNRNEVEEILYPPLADINEVYEKVKEGVTEEETVKILNGQPNTYTFTKSITEHLVGQNQVFVPTVIIRPSVVGAIKQDPMKGWLKNWFGATGITVATTRGINRVLYGRGSNIIDIVPVDYVANLVLIAGAKNGKSKSLRIYNSCSSACNPITIGRLLELFSEDAIKTKTYSAPLPSWYTVCNFKWIVVLITVLFQVIPFYLADIGRRLMGKSPKYIKLQSLIIQTRATVDFFTSHSWVMKADRVKELFASLSSADKQIFPCDTSDINWREYILDYSRGVRRYLDKNNVY